LKERQTKDSVLKREDENDRQRERELDMKPTGRR